MRRAAREASLWRAEISPSAQHVHAVPAVTRHRAPQSPHGRAYLFLLLKKELGGRDHSSTRDHREQIQVACSLHSHTTPRVAPDWESGSGCGASRRKSVTQLVTYYLLKFEAIFTHPDIAQLLHQ